MHKQLYVSASFSHMVGNCVCFGSFRFAGIHLCTALKVTSHFNGVQACSLTGTLEHRFSYFSVIIVDLLLWLGTLSCCIT